jgi:hypothetical protein
MNYLQQYKNEDDFEKHLREKYIDGLKFMQKEINTAVTTIDFVTKKSTIENAGLGLFTNKSFKKNDIVCYYPPVIIYDRINNNIIHDLDNFDHNNLDEYLSGDYIYEQSDISVIYYKDVTIKNNMYLGYLMNDNNYNPNKIYTKGKNNCTFATAPFELTTDCFKNNIPVIIKATRDIKKGDELFLSYGKSYWYNNDNNSESRHLKIKKSLLS